MNEEDETKRFASFPRSNPNPVLEVDSEGKIIFWNDAAMQTLQELKLNDVNLFLPADIGNILRALGQKTESQFYREVTIGEKVFGETLYLARQYNSVRIYAGDITDQKRYYEGMKNTLGELKNSEERYRSLVELSPDAIAVHTEGKYVYMNPSGLKLFGATDESEIIGKDVLELVHPDYREAVSERIRQSYEQRIHTPPKETRILRLNGGQADVEARSTPITYMGKPATQLIVRDITERKRAEEELQRLSQQRQLALDAASMGWWHYDPVTRMASWDDRYKIIFGVTGYKCPNDEILKRLHPEDLPGVWAKVEAALDPMNPQPYSAQYRINLPDGSMRWIDAHGIASFEGLGENRRATSFVGTVADITERKQAEEALEASRAEAVMQKNRLEAIMEALPVGIALVDTKGGNILANQAFEQIWGNPRPETPSVADYASYKAWWADNGRPVQPEEWASVRAIQRKETITGQVMEIQRFDGSRANVHNSAAPILDADGQIAGAAVAIMDITELRKAEERLRESKKLSDSLNRINEIISSTLDMDEIMSTVCLEAKNAIGCETSAISLYKDNLWKVSIVSGLPQKLLGTVMSKEEEPHAMRALESRKPVAIDDAYNDERVNRAHMRKYGIRSVLVVPLFAGDEPLGVIFLNYHSRSVIFTETQIDFVTKLGIAVSLALENARLFKEVELSKEALERKVRERTAELSKAHKIMEAEQQRLYDVLDTLPSYVVLLTPDYHVPFANSFFEGRFGRANGRCCYEYLFHRTEPCETCETFKVLKTNAPHRWEWLGPDGCNYDIYDFPFKDTDGSSLIMEVGLDITERKKAETELMNSRQQLRNLSEHLQSVREEERTRIAREIHDELGQALTSLKIDVSMLAGKLPADNKFLLEKTESMIERIDESIQTVKKICSELRPTVLDHFGLPAAIEWQAEDFQKRTGIKCEVSFYPEDIVLDKDISIVFFRIFQEALTNIMRHAGATEVKASLTAKEGMITLVVKDNGKGITEEEITSPTSFGLLGIRERVIFLGGDATISGARNKGTIIEVSLPFRGKRKGE